MADDDGGINKQAGSSIVVHGTTVAGSRKHQAWPPVDHFEKVLEETCPNHTYLIKHTQGLQHDEEFHGLKISHPRHGR
jgi:hypothetical protein